MNTVEGLVLRGGVPREVEAAQGVSCVDSSGEVASHEMTRLASVKLSLSNRQSIHARLEA